LVLELISKVLRFGFWLIKNNFVLIVLEPQKKSQFSLLNVQHLICIGF